MMTSAKGLAYFKNLCYKSYKNYIQSCFVPSLLQIEQILNKLERMFQWLPQPNLSDLKKANFCRVPMLTSLKYTVIFLSLKILFKGVVLISNKCSIPNNVKALVKLQPSVTNETIYYLSPMKANK